MVWLGFAFGTAVLKDHSLDRSIAAFQKFLSSGHAYSVEIKIEGSSAEGASSQKIVDLWVRPAHLEAQIESRGDELQLGSRWFVVAEPKRLIGYDLNRHQRLHSAGGIDQLIGLLPQAGQILLQKNQFAVLASSYAQQPGWKLVKAGHWRRSAEGQVDHFIFDPKTGLLRGLNVDRGASQTHWSFSYNVAPASPPRDGQRWPVVRSFFIPTRAPKYADPHVTELVKHAVQVADRIIDAHWLVEQDGNTIEIWRQGPTVVQLTKTATVWYELNRLAVQTARGSSVYQCKRGNVRDVLVNLGIELDPLSEDLIRHKNYVASIFRPDLHVKSIGQVTLGGIPTDVLEITEDQSRTVVDLNSQGEIRRLRTSIFDKSGQVLTESVKVISPAPAKPLPKMRKQAAKLLPKASG